MYLLTYWLCLVENLLRNVSTDSRLSWSEHPNRISAVQFQDDVIDHEDKPGVFYYTLSFVYFSCQTSAFIIIDMRKAVWENWQVSK